MSERNQSTRLFFKDGSSDKEYSASLTQGPDGLFKVNFAYGRRGGPQTPGTKTAAGLPYERALKVYSRLVQEKTAKGYTPTEGGVAFEDTALAGRASGIAPMLLNPIEQADAQAYVDSDQWYAEPKHDGERRMVVVDAQGVRGVNRRGLVVSLPQPIADAVRALGLPDGTQLDGEEIGEGLVVFDLLALGERCLRPLRYEQRQDELDRVFADAPRHAALSRSAVYRTRAEKARGLAQLRADNAEGIVFKLRSAPYSPGRPASAGPALKCKFVTSATVKVGPVNDGKRSVPMFVRGAGGEDVPVGNCTVPPNQAIPPAGALVEVRYLYVAGAALFQPVWAGLRHDLEQADGIESLKRKAGLDACAA